jgi:hypothetical protein
MPQCKMVQLAFREHDKGVALPHIKLGIANLLAIVTISAVAEPAWEDTGRHLGQSRQQRDTQKWNKAVGQQQHAAYQVI